MTGLTNGTKGRNEATQGISPGIQREESFPRFYVRFPRNKSRTRRHIMTVEKGFPSSAIAGGLHIMTVAREIASDGSTLGVHGPRHEPLSGNACGRE
jgi:hypothetical protein